MLWAVHHPTYVKQSFMFDFSLSSFPLLLIGKYTCHSMRELHKARVVEKKDWKDCAGNSDTTEAVERNIALAVRYAKSLIAVVQHVAGNTALTQKDPMIAGMGTGFCCILASLIQGEPLDGTLTPKLMGKVRSGELVFNENPDDPSKSGPYPSPEPLMLAGMVARAAKDTAVQIEPTKIGLVYGMSCAVNYVVRGLVWTFLAGLASDGSWWDA